MTAFKSQRRYLTIRGRRLHFASHDGRAPDHHRGHLGYPAMWYLMVQGHRCPVFPCDSNQSALELDAALRDWAEDNALGPVEFMASPFPSTSIAIA